MKYNPLKVTKTIIVVDEELYESTCHATCAYLYCKEHLDLALKHYSGIEEENDDFLFDAVTDKVWKVLNKKPLFISIYENYLCVHNPDSLTREAEKIIQNYSKINNLTIVALQKDNNEMVII